MHTIVEILKENQIKVLENEPLSKHTTWRVGGAARIFVAPADSKQLIDALAIINANNLAYKVIGNGSNLLFSGEGFNGAVIAFTGNKGGLHVVDSVIKADANRSLVQLSRIAAKHSLSGLEFASGIPGTVGGAVAMNVGAHGQEIANILIDAEVLTKEGELACWSREECGFSYRNSRLKSEQATLLSARFQLEKAEKTEIEMRMRRYNNQRKKSQPIDSQTAGSVFKNPEGDYAGRMIEELGLKGYTIGGAAVSTKHANFFVNTGSATAADIHDLIKYIQQKVFKEFGVMLETEVELLGNL